MGSLQVSDIHVLISSSSFGIHLCLIFLECYSGAKYYLPTLYISAFMQEVITGKLQDFLLLGNILGFAPWNIRSSLCICSFVELSVCHNSTVYLIRGVFISTAAMQMHVDICKIWSGADKSDKIYSLKKCEFVFILENYQILCTLISGIGIN